MEKENKPVQALSAWQRLKGGLWAPEMVYFYFVDENEIIQSPDSPDFFLFNVFCLIKIGYSVQEIWLIKTKMVIQKLIKIFNFLYFYM